MPAAGAPLSAATPYAVDRGVAEWAAAWSARDVNRYFAAYVPDFRPEGLTADAWRRQRAERIGRARIIEVVPDDIRIDIRDDRHASATFVQNYRSDGYRDQVEKRLDLERIGQRWLVSSETIVKILKTDEMFQREQRR